MNDSMPSPQDFTTGQTLQAAPGTVRLDAMNVSELEAAAVETEPSFPGLAFPGDDRGHSLAEMAQRDLDAALHLLADRAQYITGASGAAIALRRAGEHDMLCRASAGTNAPELGALLSAEFGLSGESVRTRLPLRCDNAETDARVNRESCRELGIASVAVMPIVSDEGVLGVFELFSGQMNAFGERDVAALQRLAEMVETAARFARAPQLPAAPAAALPSDNSGVEIASMEPHDIAAHTAASARALVCKPLLWSTNGVRSHAVDPDEDLLCESRPDHSGVPLALRGLKKCETCGFPVSDGRTLCLDCEEKSWKGQARNGKTAVARAIPPAVVPKQVSQGVSEEHIAGAHAVEPTADVSIPTADMEADPSWLGANKYVLGALLAAALAVAAVALLR